MSRPYGKFLACLAAAIFVAGCASKPRQLMPTPVIYQEPSSFPVFEQPLEERGTSTDVDLLFITNRGPETDPESTLPYGQTRSRSIAFGSARVEIGPSVSWETLERESRLAQRTRDLDLSLGRVTELGRFPNEPCDIEVRRGGANREAAAMQAVGCVAARMCNTNNCPVGIATQKPELRARLNVDVGAKKLARYFGASVELMQVMARACGHSSLAEFTADDITTWKRELADLSGIRFAGV